MSETRMVLSLHGKACTCDRCLLIDIWAHMVRDADRELVVGLQSCIDDVWTILGYPGPDKGAHQSLQDAVKAAVLLARTGPNEPDPDMVICPTCTSQFRAIPVNVQARLQELEDDRP